MDEKVVKDEKVYEAIGYIISELAKKKKEIKNIRYSAGNNTVTFITDEKEQEEKDTVKFETDEAEVCVNIKHIFITADDNDNNKAQYDTVLSYNYRVRSYFGLGRENWDKVIQLILNTTK